MESDTKHVVAMIKEDSNEAETIDWLEQTSTYCAADIAVKCAICGEYTPMSSIDYRAQGVFICDKCKVAILHIRKLLEDGGSIV